MTRLQALKTLRYDTHYGPSLTKLSAHDLATCYQFLSDHERDSSEKFLAAVNLMFLDKTEKPKAKAIIQDLLIAANVVVTRKRKAGRPKSVEGAMVKLDIRVPEGMLLALKDKAATNDLTVGEYVRFALARVLGER